MSGPLEALKDFVTREYQGAIGATLAVIRPGDQLRESDHLIWQWQDIDLNVTHQSGATGALLIDSQIGLCLYIQLFGEKTDARAQLSRALQVRSALRPRRQGSVEGADELGEWSVSLLWMMEPEHFAGWIQDIAELRHATSHFEEVSVDGLVNTARDWRASCKLHGVPRLLLKTRSIFEKKNADEAMRWSSAQEVILEHLRAIPSNLPDELAPYSSELSAAIDKGAEKIRQKNPSASVAPRDLLSVHVENFRNVGNLYLSFRDPQEISGINIIHGPNGAGKSSVSEAIALALAGVSSRYLEFLNDTNESGQGKPERYIQKYLSPINAAQQLRPRVGINSEPADLELSDADSVQENRQILAGTFFSQSWGDNLLRSRAAELGAEIAGSYSEAVGDVIEFVARRQRDAESERATFNRQWGLRANVSRDETARNRITSEVVSSIMPTPRSALPIIEQASNLDWKFRDEFWACNDSWQTWVNGQSAYDAALSMEYGRERLGAMLHERLTSYNLLCSVTSELISSVENLRARIRELAPNFEANLRLWCNWLDSRTSRLPEITPEMLRAQESMAQLQERLRSITQRGKAISEHVKSVDTIASFVREHWASDHPNECPICNSNLADKNGIVVAIESVRREAAADLDKTRVDYALNKKELDAVVARLRELDSQRPPLSEGELSAVRQAVDLLMTNASLFDSLSERPIRDRVFRALDFLEKFAISVPKPLSQEELSASANANAAKIWTAIRKFAQVSVAPEAWKKILDRINSGLTETIRAHLPDTVQALWWELARNIMPAPWQYPGVVEFEVDHRRAQPEARIVVRGPVHSPLAAHILNGAELHNVGLAWFFTRYLISGRFHYSFVVMDDPAQQMDQPTFRDFCRLLGALIRIHKVRSTPITFVMFLHQDSRALDAARTLDGTLHVMRWHQGTAALENKYRMRVSPVLPLKPYFVLQAG